jgi:hypothetical protein
VRAFGEGVMGPSLKEFAGLRGGGGGGGGGSSRGVSGEGSSMGGSGAGSPMGTTGKGKGNGLFAPACFQHCNNFGSQGFNGPLTVGNLTLAQVSGCAGECNVGAPIVPKVAPKRAFVSVNADGLR